MGKIKKIDKKDLKDIKRIKGTDEYFININGKVYMEKYVKSRNETYFREVPVSKSMNGVPKVSLTLRDERTGKAKYTTCMLPTLVYEAFRGDIGVRGNICFKDGNKANCSLDNLITVEELLDFYNKNIEIIEK